MKRGRRLGDRDDGCTGAAARRGLDGRKRLRDLSKGGYARVALALGAIQDPRAIRGLVTLAKNPAATDATRAIALASLGLVVDLERVPSLSRFGSASNYLARTDALHEALSLL